MNNIRLENIAKNIRKSIVRMAHGSQTPHAGSALSPVEILTALYFDILNINPKKPDWPERDRFILSKGHASMVLYATLAERGFFPKKTLVLYAKEKSSLTCHPSYECVPGVEATTGSLGHGLSIGIGEALVARRDHLKSRVYVLLSDGECDEGSVWEAVLFAGFQKIDNLTIFIDYNKIQSFGRVAEVLDLEPLAEKFSAFGWHVQEIDGHDFHEIIQSVLKANLIAKKPSCIIAHTVKGKGISYMEDKLEWHYKNITDDLFAKAMYELR